MSVANETDIRTWSTQRYRVNERFDAWQSMLNESHLSWSLQKRQPVGFFGNLEVAQMGDLTVSRCICEPCSGARHSLEIGKDNAAYYGLLLILSGYENVSTRGLNACLGPGNFFLWDSTITTSFYLHSNIHKVTVFFPQQKLKNALPNVDELIGKPINGKNGLAAITANLISNLGNHTSYLNTLQGQALAESTTTLIASCLWGQQPLAEDKTSHDLLCRIKDYIEINLRDPNLDPPTLADQFGISIRYLHLLFEEEQFSVARWIMERRLDHCRRELANIQRDDNITQIAYRWGFNDSAHFSRCFKQRYGLSPRQYRAQFTN